MAAHSHDLLQYLLQLFEDGKSKESFLNAKTEPVAYYSHATRSVYDRSHALEVLKLTSINARPVRYNECCRIAGTLTFKEGAENLATRASPCLGTLKLASEPEADQSLERLDWNAAMTDYWSHV